MQVPILAPRMSTIPADKESRPWPAMTKTTPVVADDD